jgi:hypothetical protein
MEHCLEATVLIVSRIELKTGDVPMTNSLRTVLRRAAVTASPIAEAFPRVNFPFALSIYAQKKPLSIQAYSE